MDGRTRTPALVAAAIAAFAVGAYFGTRGLAVARQAGFADLAQGFPTGSLRAGVTLLPLAAGGLLAVVLVAVAVVDRLPGWPVALTGLALDYLAGGVALGGGAGIVPQQPLTAGQVSTVLAMAVGAGLALGGALSALARLGPPRRWPVAAALAAGLVVHPGVADVFRLAVSDDYQGVERAWPAQAGVSVLAVAVAAVLAHLARPAGRAPAGPPRIGPVVVTALAAVLTLVGLVVRWWVVDVFRLSPDGLAGPRRARFVESVAYFSPVAVAVLAGLVLLGYAYRTGRVVAARWVVLGFAAGPLLFLGLRLVFTGQRSQAYLVVLAGVAAVLAGAAMARLRPGLLPWDAVGLLLAALAVPLAAPAVQAELPGTANLVVSLPSAVGLGLALGFGLVLVAAGPDTAPAGRDVPPARDGVAGPDLASGPDPAAGPDAACGPDVPARTDTPAGRVGGVDAEPGRAAGVLALGVAAATLSALALAPTLLVGLSTAPAQGVAVTVPVLVAACAVVLVLLFGFGRAVDRIRRDLRAEAAAGSRT
ncbi:hypothetical protein [Micromonospora humi]|uniref:Uncharacterized protein n=1 Tax=Micromonospora humi TaxID=745366 RepID=A0A1C5K8I8_9ACTN|nr:hypothetical protein [Micromonospora humi]SCG79093.1 hypothetical protein GA0070213_12431 [Micromonospora humi]